ncbi:MAG: glycosyltransferase family 4 protein [Planctomycetota bacterium]
MKIALVTTPPSVHSGIADYSRHLLPYLMERADVQPYAFDGALEPGGEELLGRPVLPVSRLAEGDHDRILYQLGNETNHHFMPGLLARFGGVVVQHDWVLFDMALKAWPGIVRGGMKGAALVAREGNLSQLRRYLGAFSARRRQYREPLAPVDPTDRIGPLIAGWHGAEAQGRWIADYGSFRLPSTTARALRLACNAPVGRSLRLVRGSEVLAESRSTPDEPWAVFEVEFDVGDEPFALQVTPVAVTAEQRQHGDSRRLGAFVESIRWTDAEGEHELDLSQAPEVPVAVRTLSDARFDLPLNASIARSADGFIVHSDYVGSRIRNLRPDVPIAVVPHGAERRWSDESRADVRREVGLPESWSDQFLVTSFGGVQAHKRIDKALAALALAREQRPGIRMVLAGKVSAEGFDARDVAERLGLGDAVHFTGFVSEELAWRLLHAGDLSINLRGPTSGGTSGGIFQAFGLGRPVIASNAGEQSELPDQCTVRVPLGEGEVKAIADALVALHDDPARLERLSEGARDYVETTCHWSHCAEGYLRLSEQAPSRRSVARR